MSWHEIGVYAGFMACVALATGIQNLTGFAFGLVLLGLLTMFDLVPVLDAANAATVLTLVNAASYFRLHRLQPEWRLIKPSILPALIGVAAGVALLTWLSGSAIQWLRGLLGLAIVACATSFMVEAKPRATLSGRPTFFLVGALSGLLGGLFSSAGPPMVYHLYRQPLSNELVRQCLMLFFAINQVLRLTLIVALGHFSVNSILLSLSALPVVHCVGWLQKNHMPPLNETLLRRFISALLLLTGCSLIASVAK